MTAPALAGIGALAVLLAGSIVVPLLSPHDPVRQAGEPLQGPSWSHPFGTDALGRDIWVRAFAAARYDTLLALVGVSVPMLIGTFVGTVAGSTRRPAVRVAWRTVIDAVNALPMVVLVAAIVGVLGPSTTSLVVAISFSNWARYARISRAATLTIRRSGFIEAAQVLHYSRRRILVRHIAPSVAPESLAYALADIVTVIVLVGALSFLGLGVRPPTPEWGAMMSEGRLFIQTEPWLILFPGLMLTYTAVSVALVAEGLARRRERSGG